MRLRSHFRFTLKKKDDVAMVMQDVGSDAYRFFPRWLRIAMYPFITSSLSHLPGFRVWRDASVTRGISCTETL
jgi:hypothetical protein